MSNGKSFRIKLNLGAFFKDHKSKAFVCIDSEWKYVDEFQDHMWDLFGIRDFHLKTADGYYLPAGEKIDVIQPGDDLSVVPNQSKNEGFKLPNGGAVETVKDPPSPNDENAKRKRVRHRKKKGTGSIEPTSDATTSELGSDVNQNSIKKGPVFERNVFRSKIIGTPNLHVRFGEDGSMSEPDEEVDLPKKPRVIAANIMGEVSLTPFADLMDSTLDVTVIENTNGNGSKEGKTENNQVSALEQLAMNLETMGKYKELIEEAKQNDIIAFKVFAPDFQKSGYIIGLVESVDTRDKPNDYDLILTIMAGSNYIEHLRYSEDENNENIQIGINRMDIFDAKLLEL